MDKFHLDGEQFKPVSMNDGEVYPEFIISNYGRLYQLEGMTPKGIKTGDRFKKIIRRKDDSYDLINNEGKKKNRKATNIVWETFNGPIPVGQKVGYINPDIEYRNSLDNLHLIDKNMKRKEKIVIINIHDNTKTYFDRLQDVAKMFGVNRTTIYRKIKSGKPLNNTYIIKIINK